MNGRQGHDGNGDGRTGHIDSSPEGNGDRIRIGVDAEFFRQSHVDRDVRCRAARKEGRHAAGRNTLPDRKSVV